MFWKMLRWQTKPRLSGSIYLFHRRSLAFALECHRTFWGQERLCLKGVEVDRCCCRYQKQKRRVWEVVGEGRGSGSLKAYLKKSCWYRRHGMSDVEVRLFRFLS